MIRKTAATVFVLLGLAAPAAAGEDHDRVRRAVLAGEILPLRVILDKVAAEFRGELIETELEDKRSGPVYEVKLVTPEGRVLELHYDARDGTLLKTKGRDDDERRRR